jgi:hypothetical protein
LRLSVRGDEDQRIGTYKRDVSRALALAVCGEFALQRGEKTDRGERRLRRLRFQGVELAVGAELVFDA